MAKQFSFIISITLRQGVFQYSITQFIDLTKALIHLFCKLKVISFLRLCYFFFPMRQFEMFKNSRRMNYRDELPFQINYAITSNQP